MPLSLSRIGPDLIPLAHWLSWILKCPYFGSVPGLWPIAWLVWWVTYLGHVFQLHHQHSLQSLFSNILLHTRDLHWQTPWGGTSPPSQTPPPHPKYSGQRAEKSSCFKFTVIEWLHTSLSHVPLPVSPIPSLLTLPSWMLPLGSSKQWKNSSEKLMTV